MALRTFIFLFFIILAAHTRADSIPVIDLLIVYPAGAKAQIGSPVEEVVQQKVNQVNTVFLNSHAQTRVRLAHVAKIISSTQTYSGGFGGASLVLDRLINPNDGYLDEVHALRDQYRADIVILFTPFNAAIRPYLAPLNPDADRAFGLVISWDSDSLAQAIGRLLGCGSEPGDAPLPIFGSPEGAFPDSYSFVLKTKSGLAFWTLNSQWSSLPVFSNPQISWFAQPLGEVGKADNVRTINFHAPIVAGFRAPVGQSLAQRPVEISCTRRSIPFRSQRYVRSHRHCGDRRY
jgi:hypothetical protein